MEATAREGGQTVTVREPPGAGMMRRYQVTDKGGEPTVAYGTVCALASGWADLPADGAISGGEGQTVTVVEATQQGALARAVGHAVLPAPTPTVENLWTFPDLPVTASGVTFTRDGDGVHVKGTLPDKTWANVNATVRLEAGDYTLSPSDAGMQPYAIVIDPSGQRVLGQGIATSTLPAGEYTLRVGAGPGIIDVDGTITPILTRAAT